MMHACLIGMVTCVQHVKIEQAIDVIYFLALARVSAESICMAVDSFDSCIFIAMNV